jgi:hypothetical protein
MFRPRVAAHRSDGQGRLGYGRGTASREGYSTQEYLVRGTSSRHSQHAERGPRYGNTSFERAARPGFVLVAIMMCLGSACIHPSAVSVATALTYRGQRRPDSQVGILRGDRGIVFDSVDSRSRILWEEKGSGWTLYEIHLLPGSHTVSFHYAVGQTSCSPAGCTILRETSGQFTTIIDVGAGNVYWLRSNRTGEYVDPFVQEIRWEPPPAR